MGRALPVEPDTNSVEEVRTWLATSKNTPPDTYATRQSWGYPARYRGGVIWDPDADLLQAHRAQRRSN